MRIVRPVWLVILIAAAGLVVLLVEALPEVRDTPTSPPVPEVGPIEPEITGFFDDVRMAVARRDGAAGAELYDPDRLYREAFATDEFPQPDPRGPVKVLNAVWDGFAAGWLGVGWTETKLTRIDRLPGGAEVVVSARHRTPGGVIPARWWLVRREGRWRAYDLEDVRVGLRLSHQVAAITGLRAGEKEYAGLETALRALSAASAALATGNTVAAGEALAPVRAARLPSPLRAVHCLTEAAVALGVNDPAAALTWADQADRARPGIPGTDLVRAVAYHRQRKWPEATAAAARYVESLGPDSQASLVLGLSLLELDRRAEAAEVLRAAVAEDPGHAALADALRRATDPR